MSIYEKTVEGLIQKNSKKIVMLVFDGLGDMRNGDRNDVLEEANTPFLDSIAKSSDLGMTIPLGVGITPGSGPAHFALFGYDGIQYNTGRGLLSALGLGFDVKPGDLCVRLNFCSLDGKKVLDRRAGRIPTSENLKLVEILKKEVKVEGVELFWITEKDHRTVLVLRGKSFSDDLTDSDPQKEGEDILEIKGDNFTSGILNTISQSVMEVLSDSSTANGVLMRGYALQKEVPQFTDKYQLKSLGLAAYPMYRGLAQLVGMDINNNIKDVDETLQALKESYNDYDFFFVHFKAPDMYGEDGNYDKKKETIESIDKSLESIKDLSPDVLIVCGDHSTPAKMKAHSFHSVPFMIKSNLSRVLYTPKSFCAKECIKGELGTFPANQIMPLALAHAGKLKKFGA